MGDVFANMTEDLVRHFSRDFGAKKVSKKDYEQFLKDVVFEKLKGKRLGEAFTERFNIRDRVLSNYTIDKNALDHIRHCEYAE